MWLTRVRVRMFGGNARQKVGEIERRVQRDEGQRGIKEILLPVGELYAAASSLIPKRKIAILTGFPCLLDFTPPTETDGPLGAVAIAKTLLAAGKEVVILTDECNEEPMLATVAGAGLSNPLLTLESFPARNNFDDDDFARLEALSR
jgi:D-glutamate cyclase